MTVTWSTWWCRQEANRLREQERTNRWLYRLKGKSGFNSRVLRCVNPIGTTCCPYTLIQNDIVFYFIAKYIKSISIFTFMYFGQYVVPT